MSQNKLPSSAAGLIWLGTNMHSGLVALGTVLGITQVTPTAFQAALNEFAGGDSAFNAFRSEKKAADAAWIAAADALEAWLVVVRTVLAGRFGSRWSTDWAQAGFTNNSSAVPDTRDGQSRLAQSLIVFFTAHPSYEVSGMQVTAARGTTLRNAALAAYEAAAEVQVNMDTQKVTCANCRAGLVALMRTVINVLRGTLPKDDPQWTAFGLNIPAARTTPGQPQEVAANLDTAGNIVLGCAPLALATRYRWRTRVFASGTPYELAKSTTIPEAVLPGVAPETVLEIIVQGVNGASQGVASEPILFTMPALAAPALQKPAGARYGHAKESAERNGNGHAVAARH